MNASRGVCGSRRSVHTSACAILCARKNGAKSARYSGAGAPRMYQPKVVSRYIGLRIPIPAYQYQRQCLHKEDEKGMGRTRRAWNNRSYISILPQAASVPTLSSPLPRHHHCRHRHNLRRLPARHPPRSHNTETQHPRPPARNQHRCYRAYHRAHAKRSAQVRVHRLHPCSDEHQRQPSHAVSVRACLHPWVWWGRERHRIRLKERQCPVQTRGAHQGAGNNIMDHHYPHPVSRPHLLGSAGEVPDCDVLPANIFQAQI